MTADEIIALPRGYLACGVKIQQVRDACLAVACDCELRSLGRVVGEVEPVFFDGV